MWMQQGLNLHFGTIEFSVDLKNTGKNTQRKIQFKSDVGVILFFMKEIIHLETMKNKRNLNTKRHLR